MTLIDGILNLLIGLTAGGVLFCLTVVCTPLAAYPIVLGILEIVQFGQISRHPPTRRELPTWLAVMQIIGFLFSNPLSLACGIIGLIAGNDESVKTYFARRPSRPAGPSSAAPPTTPDE